MGEREKEKLLPCQSERVIAREKNEKDMNGHSFDMEEEEEKKE